MKAPRVIEIAFDKDTPAFTLTELMEKLKRYEQVAIARPLDAKFKFALRVVIDSSMSAQAEVRAICVKLELEPGVNLAWNDSMERC